MIPGKNTPSSVELRSLVERVERIDEQKRELTEDRKAIMQEAKSKGFSAPGISRLVKRRRAKPHDLNEADTVDDLYRHAIGMDAEPPLFRQIEALSRDSAAGEKLLEAFKLLVPEKGEVILTIAGKKTRLWRDKDGAPHSEDYIAPSSESAPHTKSTLPPAAKRDVPTCTADEAEALGSQAAKDNKPVIDNPFPYDDARRPRWDLGWRKEMGNDGMEPDDE